MKFRTDNYKLCDMRKFILESRMPDVRILLAQLLALVMLQTFAVNAQQNNMERGDQVLAHDKLLLRQYSKELENESLPLDSAQKILARSMALAQKHRLTSTIGHIWNAMAARKYQQGDFDGCRHYLDSAFALNYRLNDPDLTFVLNKLAATMYQATSNYGKAASCYFRAVQVIRENKVKSQVAIARLYNNLGVFMIYLNDDSLAKKYLLLARQYTFKAKPVDSALFISIMVALGTSQLEKDTIAAMGYFKEAYSMAGNFNNSLLSNMTLTNLSMSYVMTGQYDSAAHFLSLVKSATPSGASLVKTEAITGLIACRKKEYITAEKHLLKALALAQGEKYDILDMIYETLSQVYAALGQYKQAYVFHKKYMEQYLLLKGGDKRMVADFLLNFQALENEKTIARKQAEISLREAALKKQRWWIVAMCVVSCLLGIILLLAYRNYRHKKSLLGQQMHSLLQEQEIEHLKAQAEGADKERSRIAYDLHDGVLVRLANVKMNLSVILESTLSPGYPNVMEQLDMAVRELRNTAHNLMPEILLEDGLAQAVFYFCKATEQASGLHIRFQQIGSSLPKLVMLAETSVYRIVQGLVQNIIQHAAATASLVQLQYADNLCSITVEDNGRGIADPENSEGYGIRSIRNRVKILQGNFDIESEWGRGTTAYLEFDVRPFLHH